MKYCFYIYLMDLPLILGDFLHIEALLLLVLRFKRTKHVLGISYKMHEIYLVVFLTRFSDMILFGHQSTAYFTLTRMILIATTMLIIYHIKIKQPHSLSYYRQYDSFFHYSLYIGAIVLALLLHQNNSLYGYLWTFSIWLEPAAIIPQIYMLRQSEEVQNLRGFYVMFLAAYRVFYIAHWIFGSESMHLNSMASELIQTAFYVYLILELNAKTKKRDLQRLPI